MRWEHRFVVGMRRNQTDLVVLDAVTSCGRIQRLIPASIPRYQSYRARIMKAPALFAFNFNLLHEGAHNPSSGNNALVLLSY